MSQPGGKKAKGPPKEKPQVDEAKNAKGASKEKEAKEEKKTKDEKKDKEEVVVGGGGSGGASAVDGEDAPPPKPQSAGASIRDAAQRVLVLCQKGEWGPVDQVLKSMEKSISNAGDDANTVPLLGVADTVRTRI